MSTEPAPTHPSGRDEKTPDRGWRRYLPIGVIAIGAVVFFWLLRPYLSFDALARNHEALIAWRDANQFQAGAVFMVVYALSVAFSVPGAIWLTLLAGFLFGPVWGAAMVVVAATTGAVGLFLAARTSLSHLLRSKAHGWLDRLESWFHEGEISFLLVIRLVPVVPFFIANLAPAFLGARLHHFIWTTAIGIIPGTVVYALIGAGLDVQLRQGVPPNLGVIFAPHILGPLLGLAFLAMLPLILRKLGIIQGKNPVTDMTEDKN